MDIGQNICHQAGTYLRDKFHKISTNNLKKMF